MPSRAAGVLALDPAGRVLMVRPAYRSDGLLLPGGGVEGVESPAAAARREVQEELGVHAVLERLLVVEHRLVRPDRQRTHFVFAATLSGQEFVLPADEIAEALWLPADEAAEAHVPTGRRRVAAALDASGSASTVHLDETDRLPSA